MHAATNRERTWFSAALVTTVALPSPPSLRSNVLARGESTVAIPKHTTIGRAVAGVVFAVGIFAVLVGLMATVYGVQVFNVSELLVGVYSLVIGAVCLWLGHRLHEAAERRERRRRHRDPVRARLAVADGDT